MMKNQVAALSLERLAHYACRPWRGSRHYEDCLQEARIGIWQATERYRPELGVQLVTYAVNTARGRVLHYLRRRTHMITVPCAERLNTGPAVVDLPDYASLESIPAPGQFEAGVILNSLLDRLPPDHARAIRLYADGYSQSEIGAILGQAQMTVCRWIRRDRARLRQLAV